MAIRTLKPFASLAETAALVRSRQVTAIDLTRQMLARIGELDGHYHSYLTLCADEALAQAATADREISQGLYRGLLHGIPLAVKDLCDTTFAPTTAGTTIFSDKWAAENATVVKRLLDAGAIILGKLTMTEGAFSNHHPDIAVPSNPWGAELWVGASSTGSGVAVAAGLCYGAIGTDTGGSIRFPSATCGLTGLKPTWGRVSRNGVFPLAESLDHIGPMARSVEDCAAILQAIAGVDAADPTSLPASVPNYSAELSLPVRGMRVGIDRDFSLADVNPEVSFALEAALQVLTKLGAEIVPIEVPLCDDLTANWAMMCAVETAVVHAATYPSQTTDYGPELAGLIRLGLGVPPDKVAALNERRHEFTAALEAVLAGVDCMIIPALPFPIPTIQQMSENAPETAGLLRFTAPFDFSGHPTLTLPNGMDRRGLPLSMQLVGSKLREDVLIRFGIAYQMATQWHRGIPTDFANQHPEE